MIENQAKTKLVKSIMVEIAGCGVNERGSSDHRTSVHVPLAPAGRWTAE